MTFPLLCSLADNARGVSSCSVIKRACLLTATIGCLAAAAPAQAQVVLFVNGDPVTNFDIEQRGKLVQLTLHKTVPRDELINDLIDDKIKISVGKRYRIDITDSDVDKQFAEMGARIHMGKKSVRAGPHPGWRRTGHHEGAHQGRDFLGDHRAGPVPGTVARQRKGRAASDGKRAQEGGRRRSSCCCGEPAWLRVHFAADPVRGRAWCQPEAIELRKKEAEALRSQFESRDTGIRYARSLRDVAVRERLSSKSRGIWRRRSGKFWTKCPSAT